jgi:hypothetical protein
MQENQTAPSVYSFRLNRSSTILGFLGLVALVVGFVAPAQAGDNTGKGRTDKPWICHPVEGNGETGTGWNLIRPDQASKHIDESTGAGFHTRKDGRTDVYAVRASGVWACPGGATSSTTRPTEHTSTHTTRPTEHTSTHTTRPTEHTSTETPSTGATSSTSTTTAPTPETPATETPATETPETQAPGVPPTVAPTTPEQAAVTENAVPQAATDGADLLGGDSTSGALRQGLFVSGGLLLLAAGLLSTRRRHTF